MTTKKYLAGLVCLGMLLQGQSYGAAESETKKNVLSASETVKTATDDLHKTVTSNNRIKRQKIDVPANVQVITREEIVKHGYRTVVDALRNVPGVYVQSAGYNATEQIVTINGDNKVLFLIDGHRINLATGSQIRNSGVDAGSLPSIRIVDRIEIVKGAAPAMYGSNGTGGVIQIFTMRPTKDSLQLEAGMGNMSSYLYDGTLTVKRGKWGLLVSGGREYQNSTGYTELNGYSSPLEGDDSGWQLHDLTMKLEREFAPDQLLTINYQHMFKKSDIPDGFPELIFGSSLRGNTRQTNSMSAKYEWNKDEDNAGSAIIYHDFYKAKNSTSNRYWEGKETKNGFEAQQQYKSSKVNTMVFGASYYNASLDNDSYADDGEYSLHNTGLAISDEWRITDSWLLNAGIRYDNHSQFGHKYTWSAGLNKKFGDTSHAYLNYGTVFNAPTGNMLYWQDILDGMYQFKGNKNLQAETGYHWTAGYDWQITPKTEVDINFFYYRLKDAITWTQDADSEFRYTAQNIPGIKSRGMEIDINHTFDKNWSANASFTTMSYETNYGTGFENGGIYEPNQYKLGVNYQKGKLTMNLWARALTGAAETNFGKSSYITGDITGQYKFTDHVTGFAGLYNLSNTAFTEIANYGMLYPARGRFIMGGVTYNF